MNQPASRKSYQTDTFQWMDCFYQLHFSEHKNYKGRKWDLKPTITIAPNSCQFVNITIEAPIVKLDIAMENEFSFDEECSWYWYKSRFIPSIKCQLIVREYESGEALFPPPNMWAEVFVVTLVKEENNNALVLHEVGIEGLSKVQLIEGYGEFHHLKFVTTSYLNQATQFHLLISIYSESDSSEQQPRFLLSRISSPLYIMAKKPPDMISITKPATKYHLSNRVTNTRLSINLPQQKILFSVIHPFNLDLLDEKIKKKRKSRNNHPRASAISDDEDDLSNSPEGLYNYSVHNFIPNKISHPIFLALKFSNAIRLYYNSNLFKDKSNQEIIDDLQSTLNREFIEDIKLGSLSGSLKKSNTKLSDPEGFKFVVLVKIRPKKTSRSGHMIEHSRIIIKTFKSIKYVKANDLTNSLPAFYRGFTDLNMLRMLAMNTFKTAEMEEVHEIYSPPKLVFNAPPSPVHKNLQELHNNIKKEKSEQQARRPLSPPNVTHSDSSADKDFQSMHEENKNHPSQNGLANECCQTENKTLIPGIKKESASEILDKLIQLESLIKAQGNTSSPMRTDQQPQGPDMKLTTPQSLYQLLLLFQDSQVSNQNTTQNFQQSLPQKNDPTQKNDKIQPEVTQPTHRMEGSNKETHKLLTSEHPPSQPAQKKNVPKNKEEAKHPEPSNSKMGD